jgi:hypothetical protein
LHPEACLPKKDFVALSECGGLFQNDFLVEEGLKPLPYRDVDGTEG